MNGKFLSLQKKVICLITSLSHPEYSSGTLQSFSLMVSPQTDLVIFLEIESHSFTPCSLVVQSIDRQDW